jgi:NAD(P)-dependent dehydrogenase (short-subunit alcohol dehydrogenase family)
MIDLFNLSGEVAVVLGGTGVLGGAMAEALAAAGSKVVVVGRNAERGAERVKAIEKAGGTASFQQADAMSRESLISARDAILKQFGKVTVLVNGAGGNKPEATIMPGGDFCKLPLEGWEAVFNLNLVGGTFLPCQIFGEPMVAAGRGSVINIASMSAILPSVARGGVLGLEGRGAEPHAVACPRMGNEGCARQRHQPRLLPGRAEPADASQG